MHHAIRTLWSLAIAGLVFAAVYYLLNATETGARLAVHSFLAQEAGADWEKDGWITYGGPDATEDGRYSAQLFSASHTFDEIAPSQWSAALTSWWEAGEPERLEIWIHHGKVSYASNGAPVTRFGIDLGMAPSQVFTFAVVFAVIAVIVARVLGGILDAKSKQQQYHRPGSIIDRERAKKQGG